MKLNKGFVAAIAICCLLPVGCKKKDASTMGTIGENLQTQTPEPTTRPKITTNLSVYATEMPENTVPSLFTGLPIYESYKLILPKAVVINNLQKALPQSGISQADIIYEVLAEGDITRLIAIFQDFNSAKIGPVRSTREYFADFAIDNGAVLVHHGGSDAGYSVLKTYKLNNLDGMALEGKTFWRDQARVKSLGMEHSSYTDTERLNAAMTQYKYNQTIKDEPRFEFYENKSNVQEAEPASTITVAYSASQNGVFKYDSEKNVYWRFQGRGQDKHIDEENGEQLSVTNVIIQLVSMNVIAGDSAGRRAVGLVGQGKGYLATNGTYIPIKWKKDSHNSPTVWMFEDGKPLTLNKGKTWINVFQQNGKLTFTED